MLDDRQIVIDALSKVKPLQSLLSVHDDKDHKLVATAIEQCEAFKSIAGQVLFSAESGVILHSPLLATHLLHRLSGGIEGAADWLFKVLTTRNAAGRFVAAIWGLSVEVPIKLPNQSALIPFDQLPSSGMKESIERRAQRNLMDEPWLSQRYWDRPTTAYVRDVKEFPYIGATDAAFKLREALHKDATQLWVLIEVAGAGQPLVYGSWFEYVDHDLDIAEFQNFLTWTHSEVPPRIRRASITDAKELCRSLEEFSALPIDFKAYLVRSAERFSLSQCRWLPSDQVLDLALAFEVAVSGSSESYAPPGWKVAVRATQMIGGDLETRKSNRKMVERLYRLRNQATHGGSLPKGAMNTVRDAASVYLQLFSQLLRHGKAPEWETVEIEPPFSD